MWFVRGNLCRREMYQNSMGIKAEKMGSSITTKFQVHLSSVIFFFENVAKKNKIYEYKG